MRRLKCSVCGMRTIWPHAASLCGMSRVLYRVDLFWHRPGMDASAAGFFLVRLEE